ncbi:hypothetical protein FACS1894120_6210 [Clostridia bacterium]|nr:hypothetical protein FACS1894120_6210 [Clostridia bacterium]
MNEIKFEIEWRKELIKRLEYPRKQLCSAREREKEKRTKQTQKLMKYESYDDAQEAYGYAEITAAELKRIEKMFDSLEDEPNLSISRAAYNELGNFLRRLRSDIRSLEWENLPDSEKERIERETAERHAKHNSKHL